MLSSPLSWALLALATHCRTIFCQQVAPRAPAVSDAGPELDVSPDGSCGQGFTCLGSTNGPCCSRHFFCGKGDAYCGAGCLPAFGNCDGGDASTPSPADAGCASATTRTATIQITLTSQATETSTQVVTKTAFRTSTSYAVSPVESPTPSILLHLEELTRLHAADNRIDVLRGKSCRVSRSFYTPAPR